MNIDCQLIASLVQDVKIIRDCDKIRNNWTRMSTAFKYPNGSNVDVFASNVADATGRYIISDQGQTYAYLMEQGVKPWTTAKRKQMVQDICSSLGISNQSGELSIHIAPDSFHEVPEAIIKVGQACIRIAEMQWAQRLKANTTFDDEVEEYIESLKLVYSAGSTVEGVHNHPVKVDYIIHGKTTNSMVQTITTANVATARGRVNEAIRRWLDLQRYRNNYQFITIFDASTNVFKQEDIDSLGEQSMTIGFPAEIDEFKEAVAA